MFKKFNFKLGFFFLQELNENVTIKFKKGTYKSALNLFEHLSY